MEIKSNEVGLTTIEDKIKEWLLDVDYSDATNFKVLEINLFRDYIYWCSSKGYDVSNVTVKGLSNDLLRLGYKRIRKEDGMAFIMSK